MVLWARFRNADGVNEHDYLRARGAKAPESIENKFMMYCSTCNIPDELQAAIVNLVFCLPAGPRVLAAQCGLSQDRQFAYLSQEEATRLFRMAATQGVPL
jgi:hypothetical protein